MNWEIVHIAETDSTNRWLKENFAADNSGLTQTKIDAEVRESPLSSDDNIVVVAEYQTAGRGCGSNQWESERGKNLTFSLLIHPDNLAANKQFQISMTVSLAICEALGQHIGDLSIKWPNDIYWRNGKICGILIENTLHGSLIRNSIIGVGINVNQRTFLSDAPNPVSIWQITEQETDCEQLLNDILRCMEHYLGKDVRSAYCAMLYRRQGYHPYVDKDGAFMAEIVTVEDDGQLVLRDDNGKERRYAFKEIQFII